MCVCDVDLSAFFVNMAFMGTSVSYQQKKIFYHSMEILSYFMKLMLSFSPQPFIIKISTRITVTIFSLGLIDAVLTMLAFEREDPR